MKAKTILIAILIFGSGIMMQAVYGYFYPGIASCNDGTTTNYIPKTVVTAHCQYGMDVGQEVTLYAIFYDSSGLLQEIRIPSHVELRGPDNEIILGKDIDSRFTYQFKPSKIGNYTATFTNLEDPDHPQYSGYTRINYGLGFFPESPYSSNYIGRILVYMWFAGYLMMFGGIGLGIYAVVKNQIKKKQVL